jgi:hypothetical protein
VLEDVVADRHTSRLAGDSRPDSGASWNADIASLVSLRGEELVGVAVSVRSIGSTSQGSHSGGGEGSLHYEFEFLAIRKSNYKKECPLKE